MNTQQRAAMQMALEALEVSTDWDVGARGKQLQSMKAITALREALSEQAEQEPVIGAYEVVNEKGDEWSLVYPVAVHKYKSIPEERITQTFYAAPVRTKDLTDDDLEKTYDEICRNASSSERLLFRFARAVIAADREKNK